MKLILATTNQDIIRQMISTVFKSRAIGNISKYYPTFSPIK